MNKEHLLGITKIAVKGFKSIAEECEIDIRPLTILAGANSSGKSSIMQPLLMLKQTLEVPFDPGPLMIDGPNVKFTVAEQFLSTLIERRKTDRFHIGIKCTKPDLYLQVTTTFVKKSKKIELLEMTVDQSPPRERFTLYPKMTTKEIKMIVPPPSLSEDADCVRRSACFLRLVSKGGYFVFNAVDYLADEIFNTIHLPGIRGNPDRINKLSSASPWYPGTFDSYAASVIHEWQETTDDRLKTVTNALHTLELTGRVATKKIGDVGIEVQVGRLPHTNTDETDMVNIADVGIGVSQVLPVLVAVIAAEPGQLVYIEQPELHLHPNAQVKLAQVLADAAKRGVRVVTETHSSLLLLGIQTLVAEGKLSPDLVKLHWFSRNEEGITEVDSVDLDEAGTYGEWPVDFNDVNLNAQSRYIKASRSRFIEGT
ncbi:MAG: AAA family ATPase [Candidatus Poribacteria bacterium]|nr:AAA family ATPase [Candidatus Poribacteria bacterium]